MDSSQELDKEQGKAQDDNSRNRPFVSFQRRIVPVAFLEIIYGDLGTIPDNNQAANHANNGGNGSKHGLSFRALPFKQLVHTYMSFPLQEPGGAKKGNRHQAKGSGFLNP